MNELKYRPLNESHANDLLSIWADEDVIRSLFADVVADNVASGKRLQHFGFDCISEEDGFERNGIKMKIHNYRLFI